MTHTEAVEAAVLTFERRLAASDIDASGCGDLEGCKALARAFAADADRCYPGA